MLCSSDALRLKHCWGGIKAACMTDQNCTVYMISQSCIPWKSDVAVQGCWQGDGGECINYIHFLAKPLVIQTSHHMGILGGINVAASLI